MLTLFAMPMLAAWAGIVACPADAPTVSKTTPATIECRIVATPHGRIVVRPSVAHAEPNARVVTVVTCNAAQTSAPADDAVSPPRDQPRTGVSEPGARATSGMGWLTTVSSGASAASPAPEPGEEDDDENDESDEPLIASGGPWLGIQFGPVPEAVAAHLNTKNGMILLNIVKGAPADEAGLRQYDVVLSIGGREINTDIKEIGEAAKQLQTGQIVEIKLIRGGKPMSASLTVGVRPDNVKKLEYKYETPPEVASAQFQSIAPQFYTLRNGHLFEPDADAYKQLQSLLPLMREKQAIESLRGLKGLSRSFAIVRQTEDGQTIEIRTEPDGKIKVSRTDKDGDKSSHVYASEDELKAEDADAFKVYDESRKGHAAGAFVKPDGHSFSWNFKRGAPNFDKRLQEALEAYRRTMKTSRLNAKELEKAQAQFEKHMRELFDESFGQKSEGVSFQRRGDGSIEVTTRGGGDELVEVFKDENALKNNRPDIYKRYTELRTAEVESPKK